MTTKETTQTPTLKKNTAMTLKTKTKAGGRMTQHNQKLKIKTKVKAGGLRPINHNQKLSQKR